MPQKDQWKKQRKIRIKISCDAYTAGVNAYIENLKESELPLEYKLLDYKPENGIISRSLYSLNT
jgi:acyl-homoserine lactone acylase PvdQ